MNYSATLFPKNGLIAKLRKTLNNYFQPASQFELAFSIRIKLLTYHPRGPTPPSKYLSSFYKGYFIPMSCA